MHDRAFRRQYLKKEKSKIERSQIAHIKPFFKVKGKPNPSPELMKAFNDLHVGE